MFHMQAGGAFSDIFGSPGGTDGNYPMIPNETYTITMELVKNTTWGFFINGHPIIEPGLDGYLNTTSRYANGGVTMGCILQLIEWCNCPSS